VKFKFTIPESTPINKIPYIIEDNSGKDIVGLLDFSSTNTQEFYVDNMGSQNIAVYFIPFIGSEGQTDKTYYYSWEATTMDSSAQTEKEVIVSLQQRIVELQRQIAQLKLELAMLQTNKENITCSDFSSDLYYGMTSPQVKCLQQFLANLGSNIYPEKLVTGYYGPLTMAAVQKYQALKGIITTGYFGPLTRAAVNQNL
jgi:murein L,D-transpeptidase YcbB/YkuD